MDDSADNKFVSIQFERIPIRFYLIRFTSSSVVARGK